MLQSYEGGCHCGRVRFRILVDLDENIIGECNCSVCTKKGIPTVGLYTGASGAKSEKQASLFGGTAGRPFDPCYHQACDTVENIDRNVLEQNTQALVRALKAVAVPAGEPERRKAP